MKPITMRCAGADPLAERVADWTLDGIPKAMVTAATEAYTTNWLGSGLTGYDRHFDSMLAALKAALSEKPQ